MLEKTKKYFKKALHEQYIEEGYDTEDHVNQYNMAFWEDVMVCVESERILHGKHEKIKSRELETACDDIIYNSERCHLLFKLNEKESEEHIKQDIGDLGRGIFRCLYPFILFIPTNTNYILEKCKDEEELYGYNLLFFLSFFIGINEEYTDLSLAAGFAKELKRCLTTLEDEEQKEVLRKVSTMAGQLESNSNSLEMAKYTETLKEGIYLFQKNATAKQLERKVESTDMKYLSDLFRISKDKKGISRACVLYCVDLLTNWITYLLFVKSRKEKKEEEKIKSDGYYSRFVQQKTYNFRTDYFDYTGIALKYLSIKKFPDVSELAMIDKMTRGFWYETEQFRKELIKVVAEMDAIGPCSYDIYEKLYDELASTGTIDLGKKKDLCIFFDMMYA